MATLQKFPRYYTASDFGFGVADSDVILTSGKWTEVGSFKVGAQQQLAWGSGSAEGNNDTRRNIKFKVTDGTNTINGVVRFAYANATKTDIKIVLEDRTENLADGVPLEEITYRRAREDSYLIVYMLVDSATDVTIDVSDANNVFLAPATLYQ